MIMHAKGSNMILGEARVAPTNSRFRGLIFVPVFSCVYYLVPPPPSPLVSWNQGVSGNFSLRSLKNKGLYQSIPE